jgi:hypothetical protein
VRALRLFLAFAAAFAIILQSPQVVRAAGNPKVTINAVDHGNGAAGGAAAFRRDG